MRRQQTPDAAALAMEVNLLPRGLKWFGLGTALVLAALLLLSLPPSVLASGTITGSVFRDYNSNGVMNLAGVSPNAAIDKHISGVTVTAYDSGGNSWATTSIYCTGAGAPQAYCTGNGTGPNYSLSVGGTGPYRVEFTWDATTAFPSNALYGYQSGPQGTNSGSSVQFVADPAGGTTANINFGILQPEDYSQNDPKLATPLQAMGNRTSATPNYDALVTWDYGKSNALTTRAVNSQIGSTFGLAFDKNRNKLYAAAFLKRHSDFGPNGSGAIYEIDPTTASPTLFVDLMGLSGINTGNTMGPRNLATNAGDADHDDEAFGLVGKYSLGDIDVSADSKTLYIVNLYERKLIALDIATKTVNAQYDLATLPSGATTCLTANLRPFGIKIYRDQVYVGIVCSAEGTTPTDRGNAALMRGYIWRLNGSTFENVFDFPLNYTRVRPGNETTRANEWHPWVSTGSATFPVDFGASYFDQYAQPQISDIEFDDKDNLFIGMTDRWGNQTGSNQFAPNSNNANEAGASAGDILLACRSGAGWVLENGPSDGTCRGWDLAKEPSKSGGGPNLGEFIFGESNNENESSFGMLAVLHGTGKITLSTGDPIDGNSGGVAYLTAPIGTNPSLTDPDGQVNPTGLGGTAQDVGRYTTYTFQNGRWGKGTGMGDIELLSLPAPLEIGNRVWKDTNANGKQEPDEATIPNVQVQLYNPTTSTVISTVQTDANGNYLFSNATGTDTTWAHYGLSIQPNTTYQIRILNAEGPGQQTALATARVAYISPPLNDPTLNGYLRDSNGQKISAGGGAYNSIAAVTTGGYGANNHSIDFGFNNVTPTANDLDSFEARSAGNKVVLTWETSNELNVVGFNVWRAQGKQQAVKINKKQIPAANPGQPRGATYTKRDKQVKAGKRYSYILEVLHTNGKSTWSEIRKLRIPKE